MTDFSCTDQTNYVVELMAGETRRGIITMSAASALLYAIASVGYACLEMPQSYL